MDGYKQRVIPLLEAFLVTLLWSSSYIIIKNNLLGISPLTFASLRYIIGFTILLIITSVFSRNHGKDQRVKIWVLVVLGLTGYSIAQGLQFVGLARLPATTVTFILNFTPLMVLILDMVFMKLRPLALHMVGLAVALLGAYVFFSTSALYFDLGGVAAALVSGLGWAIYLVLMRQQMKNREANVMSTTTLTMGIGAWVLFPFWLVGEGVQPISFSGWGAILWLSIFNTAFAFALWNHALKHVETFRLSILQNTMLVQVAVLAYFFLNETLVLHQIIGMLMVIVGVILVQLRSRT